MINTKNDKKKLNRDCTLKKEEIKKKWKLIMFNQIIV